MCRFKIHLFLFVFLSAIAFASYGQQSDNEVVLNAFSEMDFNTVYYPQKASLQLDSIINSFNNSEKLTYKGHIEYIRAQLFYNQMEVDSSLYYVEDAISYFTDEEDKEWLARCQFLLGRIAETTGLYEQAKINYYETIKLSETSEERMVGFAYIAVARCMMTLSEDYEAEVIKGVEILKESPHEEVQLYADFMEQYFRLMEPDTPGKLNVIANKYLDKKVYNRAVNVYKIVASSYHAQQEYDSAHLYCDKAIQISEEYNVGHLILPALYQFKGVLYFKQKKYKTANDFFDMSLDLYAKFNQHNRMLYTYNYLHQIDLAQNDYKKAYSNLHKYIDLVEKTTSSEKIRMAKVLEINNKVGLMKGQLAQMKIEKKASEFMLYLVLLITAVILVGVAIYVYLYQKNKKAKIEELNKEFHNLLIGIGEKQLLEHRLSTPSQSKKRSTSRLTKELNVNGMSEEDLSDNFDSCYMETIGLLTGAFPQLTRTEVRYAVMICLKLPMEVISKVQNVQPASIRKAKQRIRTKLNVSCNLDIYLQQHLEKLLADLAQ
ncbi:hypothetical protein SAMN06265379_102359 [Saccharicrinis carchari]|uniref:Uncharacterized protein n=1 Tax=Saccharicrinis carchari TaxID=1168039 RepID=A0A521C3S7_SACCC|nr:tetratricopeptide repeat protein [Saccharicrinis carchari]SMO54053.1 hypothetical protein SAMN06265379_102359 [Saccharicrinis carchari]